MKNTIDLNIRIFTAESPIEYDDNKLLEFQQLLSHKLYTKRTENIPYAINNNDTLIDPIFNTVHNECTIFSLKL